MLYKLVLVHVLISLIPLSVSLSENNCEKGCSNNATIIHRSKRYLDFLPLSRMFVCCCCFFLFKFMRNITFNVYNSFALISKTTLSKLINFGLNRMVSVQITQSKIISDRNVVMCMRLCQI